MKYLLILLFPFAANSQVVADTSYFGTAPNWIKVVSYRNANTTVFVTAAKLQIKTDSLATALASQTAATYATIANLSTKQNTISVTTTGSGAATWNGTTLNVPTPAGGGLPGYASVKRTADTTLLLTTLANVGDLKFTVTAGTYYHFRYVLVYSSPALTTGIRISLTYPAVTTAAASVTIQFWIIVWAIAIPVFIGIAIRWIVIKASVLFCFVTIPFFSFGQSQPESVNIQTGTNAKVEYVNNQVSWLRLYMDAEVKAIREAVSKVEVTNTAKFEAQNEWRQQFKDQTQTFLTRRELWGAVGSVLGIVSTLALFIFNYIKKEKKINGH